MKRLQGLLVVPKLKGFTRASERFKECVVLKLVLHFSVLVPHEPPIGMVLMHVQQFQWEGIPIHQTFPRKLLLLVDGTCINGNGPESFPIFRPYQCTH
jgi:hypothetical protein